MLAMFKKGITGKDSEMMTGKHLGPEPKKKKKFEANQVCSWERTPVAAVGDSVRNCPGFLNREWIVCGHLGQGQGPPVSGGRERGMPGYTVVSDVEKQSKTK